MANFVIKGLRLLVFPGSLVINNHVHFSIHPPSLNKSVHFDPRLLSIKNRKDSKPLLRALQRQKMKFYKYGTHVFYKQLMDILYVNAEEFYRNFPFQGWTDTGNSKEKTRFSHLGYHERILFAETSVVKLYIYIKKQS